MITVFNKRYKSISNLFIETYEGYEYTFPSPISLNADVADEKENRSHEFEFLFSNYYDSLLILDYYFDCFFYLLGYDYKIDTLFVKNLLHKSDNQEMNGHRAIYSFMPDDLTLNLGDDEVYDRYKKFEKTAV
jgi:hypothetical protein